MGQEDQIAELEKRIKAIEERVEELDRLAVAAMFREAIRQQKKYDITEMGLLGRPKGEE